MPARRLLSHGPLAGGLAAFFGTPSAEHDWYEKRQIFLLKDPHDLHGEECPIEKKMLYFQADFADLCEQTSQNLDHRFLASHHGQSQRITSPILHDACRSISVKLRCPLLRFALVDFAWALVRLSIVRLQMIIDRDRPSLLSHLWWQLFCQAVVQPLFQHGGRFGQAIAHGRENCLIRWGMSHVPASSRYRNRSCRSPEHNSCHQGRCTFPPVVFDKFCIDQTCLSFRKHFIAGYDTIGF